ncbi:MAG: PAS domain-containing protein [Pseudomonadales bacterium]
MKQQAIQGAQGNLEVAILADDVNLCAMLQHALALSHQPRFRVDIVSPANFDAGVFTRSDLVFIDRTYRAQPYMQTLLQMQTHTVARPLLVLLLDDRNLASDLGGFTEAVRRGVDAMLLRSEVSLQRILALLPAHAASTATAAQTDAVASDTNAANVYGSPAYAAIETGNGRNPSSDNLANPAFASSPGSQTAGAPVVGRYLHELAIDLESQRIHIASASDSPLFDEPDTLLSLADWQARLDQRGSEQFAAMLQAAADYRNIPRSISCDINSDGGAALSATIGDIQIKNNGQGRVVGASAVLTVFAAREAREFAPRAGFDNLFDPAGESTELLAGQQHWENIARSLPMMCLLLDENGIVVRVINNEQHLHQNFPRAEAGRRLSEILDIESLDNLVDTIARTLNTGKEHQQTIAYAGAQGVRWLDTHISKLKGDAGLSRQVVWTAYDITSTRHAYQELLKAHDELFHILDEAPVLFFQKDGQGRFLRANKTFCEHFGLRADVISGRHDEEIFRDSAAEFCRFGQHVAQSLLQNAGQLTAFAYSEVRNEIRQQLYWQAIPLQQAGKQQVEGYAGFGFLPDEKSFPALQSAPGSSDDESATLELSGAVGRDFNVILNAIIKYTEMAIAQKNQAREQRIADHLEEVLKTAAHAHELVAHKASRQSDRGDSAGTKLQPLIEEVIEMMRPSMPATLKLKTSIDAAAPAAMIAETPFKQIVLQLLVSARNTAIAAQEGDNDDQEILLSLSQDKLPNAECSACEDRVSGDYIVLAVHTRTADVSSVDLQKLIVAARTATRKNAAENVVAMAHNNSGHAIIERQDNGLALQLLFRKA